MKVFNPAANKNAVLNNYSEQLPQTQGGQEISDQMIAFAVLSFPKKHNFQTHTLLQNGVKGLLRRAGYETKPAGSYFRDFFSVGVLHVTQKDETPALLTLREILETFSTCFLIARYSGGYSWMLLFPQESNESDFQNIFFIPSQIANGEAQLIDEFQQRDMALAWLRNVARKLQSTPAPPV